MNYYKEYTDVDLSSLKDWERQAIEIFKDAVKVCGDIYDKQKNSNCPGGNFYPCEIPKEQLETFAKENPEIFSPYTMVEIDQMGKISAVKYSQKFEKEIAQISEALEKAAPLYEQNGFSLYSSYLRQLSKDLKNDDYEESEKIWLKIDWKVNVDIKLGPIETYQDKLFGVKRAFQANLRITDNVDSNNIGEYIDLAYALADYSKQNKTESQISQKNIIVRVDKVVAMSGWHAEFVPRTSNYPADISHINFGSKVIIYSNNIAIKQVVIQNIISKLFVLNSDDLKGNFELAFIRLCTLHEIAETVSKQEHSKDYGNFGQIEDSFIELNAEMAALKIASYQVLKGVFSSDDYRFMIIEFIASALRGWVFGRSSAGGLRAFSDGHKVILNYLLQEGALKINSNDRIEADMSGVYTCVDILNKNLHTYLVTRDQASIEKTFSKYSSDDMLEKLRTQLEDLVFGKEQNVQPT